MTDFLSFADALIYASDKHGSQQRKGGEPYIVHPLRTAKAMAEKGLGRDYILTALFHDLLEDTDADETEILALGGERVLKSVRILTKWHGYVMRDYVAAIKNDEIAFEVKKADRLDNLRSCRVCSKSFIKKYVEETEKWYMDFSEEIRNEVFKLKKLLDEEN